MSQPDLSKTLAELLSEGATVVTVYRPQTAEKPQAAPEEEVGDYRYPLQPWAARKVQAALDEPGPDQKWSANPYGGEYKRNPMGRMVQDGWELRCGDYRIYAGNKLMRAIRDNWPDRIQSGGEK